MQERFSCFRLSRAGKYEEVRPRNGVIASSVIRGFWIRPAWLWQRPLPSKTQVLKEIVAPRHKRKENGHVAP
jgi:hypothetical protein